MERCPTCNGPSTGKWYLDDREMVIGNAAEVGKAKAKRAWKCGHCNHMKDADYVDPIVTGCDACGNPKDISTDDKQQVSREYKAFQQPKSGDDVEDARMEGVTNEAAETEQGLYKSGRTAQMALDARLKVMRKRKWVVAGIGLGILGLITLLLIWKKEVPVTVVGFGWERTVDIDNFGPVQESSWYSAPSGVYNVSSSREIHHYNTIVIGLDRHTESYQEVCGTTDNGNGTFSDRY